MNRTSLRRLAGPGVAALALTMTLSACGAGNEGTTSDGDSLSGNLAGGGSSAQGAAQDAWVAKFLADNPDLDLSYDPVGSGGGREGFVSGAFAFAGSDAYLTDDEGELSAATERCQDTDPITIPDYVSPIAIIFNIDGVDELNLKPATLGKIFSGKIKKWNDPMIAADNPDADLPNATINPVHRGDESGTTENFTDYLDAAATKAWGGGVLEIWPKKFGGEAAKGTSGVVAAVQNGENAIGYADASQAGDLGVASIGVGGDFVAPSSEAAAKILEVSSQAETATDTQMVYDLDHTTAEAGTYPIVLTSYLMACQKYEDADEAALVKAYIEFILSDEGQAIGEEEAGAAPLSAELSAKAKEIVAKIS